MRRTWASFVALAFAFAFGGAAGCTAYPTLKSVPADCSAESRYDLVFVDRFDMAGGNSPGWTSVDCAPLGATMTAGVVTIPDGARCDSAAALQITASRNNDWGSLFGYNNFRPPDVSAYEGLSFWARAPGSTTKSFTVLLDDPNTTNTDPAAIGPDGTPMYKCKSYSNVDAGTVDGGCGSAAPPMVIYDPSGIPIPGSSQDAPPPDACGNGYSTVVQVSSNWQFMTIPFALFQQNGTPNRVPNDALTETGRTPGTTLLTDRLQNLIFRMPKEAVVDLWIDNLSFYRKKAPGAAGDGGADAPTGQ